MTTATSTATTRRRRSARLTLLGVSGATALALTLAGCGGDDTTPAAASSASATPTATSTASAGYQVVLASAQQSAAANSAKFSLTVAGTTAGQALNVTADGAFDAKAQAVQMKLTLPAAAGGSAVSLRLVGGHAYLSGAPLTADGSWAEVPLSTLAQSGFTTSTTDPAALLQQLQGASNDVTEVPATTVRGVQVKGYQGSIDLAKALAQLPAGAAKEQAQAAATQSGITQIPFTLYVDAQNRPARLTEQVTANGSTTSISMDFYDWGSAVDVTAPDAASLTSTPAGTTAG
jgi:hypothetical protein